MSWHRPCHTCCVSLHLQQQCWISMCHLAISWGFRCTLMQQTACLLLPHPTGITSSGHHPTGATRPGVQQGTSLDISKLHAAVERFLGIGIAPSIRSMYKSAKRRYSNFCIKYEIQDPYPLQNNKLCSYVAFLAEEGLKHRTIKAYLVGICCLQIHKALGNLFANGSMPHLEYVLSGIK